MKLHLPNVLFRYQLVAIIVILLLLQCLCAASLRPLSNAKEANRRHAATDLLFTSAFAQIATYSYENTTTGAINESSTPCSAPLIRTLSVTDDFIITDLDVGLTISHAYRDDLHVTLQ